MPSIEDAIILATEAHRGQTDKAGLPYILHPLRVMSSFLAPEDEDARMVAVLHDVVEDTHVDMDRLMLDGYSQTVLDAVDAISRRNEESYRGYIERVAMNPLALRVKVADLRDNLDGRRVSTRKLPPDVISQYRSALMQLVRVAGAASKQSTA